MRYIIILRQIGVQFFYRALLFQKALCLCIVIFFCSSHLAQELCEISRSEKQFSPIENFSPAQCSFEESSMALENNYFQVKSQKAKNELSKEDLPDQEKQDPFFNETLRRDREKKKLLPHALTTNDFRDLISPELLSAPLGVNLHLSDVKTLERKIPYSQLDFSAFSENLETSLNQTMFEMNFQELAILNIDEPINFCFSDQAISCPDKSYQILITQLNPSDDNDMENIYVDYDLFWHQLLQITHHPTLVSFHRDHIHITPYFKSG